MSERIYFITVFIKKAKRVSANDSKYGYNESYGGTKM